MCNFLYLPKCILNQCPKESGEKTLLSFLVYENKKVDDVLYEDRLSEFVLFSLEKGRLWGSSYSCFPVFKEGLQMGRDTLTVSVIS